MRRWLRHADPSALTPFDADLEGIPEVTRRPEPNRPLRESRGMGCSFDEVFRAEYAPLHRYLYRRLGTSLADDLAAETFATAFRRWSEFDASRPVRPWLFGIAANLLRHHWRRERRMLRAYARSGIDHGSAQVDEVSLSGVEAQRQQRALATALAELRPAEREILLLHAWAELSDAEIAEAISAPVGTVKSRLNRARLKMRNRLVPTGQLEVNRLTPTVEE
jgi:RNA polymerase sigma factor (sigma-70 family)